MHTAIFLGVPYIFDQLGLALPRTFYQNSRSLSYQHVANLLHLDVSFLDYLAVMLQLILLKILLLELFFFLSLRIVFLQKMWLLFWGGILGFSFLFLVCSIIASLYISELYVLFGWLDFWIFLKAAQFYFARIWSGRHANSVGRRPPEIRKPTWWF